MIKKIKRAFKMLLVGGGFAVYIIGGIGGMSYLSTFISLWFLLLLIPMGFGLILFFEYTDEIFGWLDKTT